MVTSEKPKKMRRVWPFGSGVQPPLTGCAAATAALVFGTCAVKMPFGDWKRPAESVDPLTTTWLLVYLRGPLWLNCTLARSVAGHWSPEPMVSPIIFQVAVAPLGGGTMTPWAFR